MSPVYESYLNINKTTTTRNGYLEIVKLALIHLKLYASHIQLSCCKIVGGNCPLFAKDDDSAKVLALQKHPFWTIKRAGGGVNHPILPLPILTTTISPPQKEENGE